MDTIEQIKNLVESLSNETTKFYTKNNQSAGTRARKLAQQIKELMPVLRKEILNHTKEEKN
jgi:archaellum component FlaC